MLLIAGIVCLPLLVGALVWVGSYVKLTQPLGAGDKSRTLSQGRDRNAQTEEQKSGQGESSPTSQRGGKRKVTERVSKDVTLEMSELSTTPLHEAAANGDLAKVQQLLRPRLWGTRIDVNARDGFGATALHEAAEAGHKEVAEFLIAKGADVNAKTHGEASVRAGDTVAWHMEYTCTPLHLAAEAGHKDVVELLIAHGADINAKDHGGETALHKAAGGGHQEIVQLLLDKGADASAADKMGLTPQAKALHDGKVFDTIRLSGTIHGAAMSGNVAAVKKFLQDKPSLLNARDPEGRTPLFVAVGNGRAEVVKLLLSMGADANAGNSQEGPRPSLFGPAVFKSKSPLFVAVEKGHADIVDLLIAAGANVNAKNDEGEVTALYEATRRKDAEIVERLLKAGADVNVQLKRGGGTPLLLAAALGDKRIVEMLVAKGADLSFKPPSGSTVLHEAAKSGQKDVVEFLLTRNVDLNAVDSFGRTPLDDACQKLNNNAVVRVLLEHNANPNTKDVENSPLRLAVGLKDLEMAGLLLDHGADPNLADRFGETPLHRAVSNGQIEMVRLLLAHKADPNRKAREGIKELTPIEMVGWSGRMNKEQQEEMKALLRQHGAKE
jgi:ankyrin repeat protein